MEYGGIMLKTDHVKHTGVKILNMQIFILINERPNTLYECT